MQSGQRHRLALWRWLSGYRCRCYRLCFTCTPPTLKLCYRLWSDIWLACLLCGFFWSCPAHCSLTCMWCCFVSHMDVIDTACLHSRHIVISVDDGCQENPHLNSQLSSLSWSVYTCHVRSAMTGKGATISLSGGRAGRIFWKNDVVLLFGWKKIAQLACQNFFWAFICCKNKLSCLNTEN